MNAVTASDRRTARGQMRQIEGSRAIAESVALCRPRVICAYPITPQTHIVEALSEMVRTGALSDCEFINVESEFAALSVAIGASAAGVRVYTATSSQGLLFMAEAVYNASGLGLPIVMTLGNRAIGAPINIWNDHSDAMSMKDAGWIMLFAETNQEAADLHIQAFELAETLGCPVMVNVDGFILTHAFEPVAIPDQSTVDGFLGRPSGRESALLDLDQPVSIGAMVGPEAFTEVRYLAHLKHLRALEFIPDLACRFNEVFGRESGGLVHRYRSDDAETVVVSLGSINGTVKDVVDSMRDQGEPIGSMSITTFRPFPTAAVRSALMAVRRVIVLEKNLATGMGGILSTDVKMSLQGTDVDVRTVIVGLGGRPVTGRSLRASFADAIQDRLGDLTFLDLNWTAVNRALEEAGLGGAPPRKPGYQTEVKVRPS